jgi:hypothetical protein
MFSKKDIDFLLYMLIIIIIWFKFLSPGILNPNKNENFFNANKNNQKVVPKSKNLSKKLKISNAMCSKSCCGKQWPTPFEMKDDRLSNEDLKRIVPNNFSCQGDKGHGCVCIDKETHGFLSTRGNNI